MNAPDKELIIGFHTQKVELLKEILACAQIQSGINFEEHSSEYENLVETRERCIENLKHLDEVIQEQSANLQSAERDTGAIKDLSNQAQQLIQQILILDERNKAAFINEMSSIEKRLKNLRQGKKGIAGYNGNLSQPGGIFTDSRR